MARSLEIVAGDAHGPSSFARWVIPALLVSLLLHAGFYLWAEGWMVRGMSTAYYDTIVPRTFRLERVEIDPALLQPEPEEKESAAMAPTSVTLPEDRVSFEKLMGETTEIVATPAIEHTAMEQTPSLPSTDLQATLETARTSGAESLLEDNALRETLLADNPAVGPLEIEQAFKPEAFAGSALAPPGALQGGTQPGFSNLDELLATTGPLSPETAPILMPTDLLFDYDSAELRAEAAESLVKLGTLILRNPQAKFLIEGHSDSFGSDAYNLDLSTQRAETVRSWLGSVAGIPHDKVTVHGFGKTQLIAPATGTIQEQQINRRVEIVILPAEEE